MTITDKEDTTICNNFDDATQIVDHSSTSLKEEEKNDNDDTITTSEDNITKHKTVKTVGGIALGGVLLGTAASVFMDMKGAPTAELPDDVEELEENDTVSEGIVLPEIIVEALELLPKSPVNERMTFEEAFSAARDAMGPGYAFEWHGNVYATYTQEEWAELSDDQKSDFYDDLELSNPYKDSADAEHVDQNAPIQEPVESPVAETEVTEQPETEAEPEVESDPVVEVEPEPAIESEPEVEVEPAVEQQSEIEVVPEVELEPVVEAEAVVETAVDPLVVALDEEDIEVVHIDNSDNVASGDMEVEILGVVQDPTTGYNIGTMTVDGQDVYVIDVDGDMVFDGMAMDFNNDGVIDNDEIIDISDDGLTVADLGGLEGQTDTFNSTPDTDMLGSNSGPDYMSEMMS